MDPAALRKALWSAPLPDRFAPAQDIAREIAGGGEYLPALERVQSLLTHGLPGASALIPALARWDWSIDLARFAMEADMPDALVELRRRVQRQRRRYGALAQALWAAGHPAQALEALADSAPDCETRLPDQVIRAELALSLPDPEHASAALDEVLPLLPPGPATRLRLMAIWQRDGAAALALVPDATLPDHPAPLGFLLHAWLTERDLPRARAVLSRLAAVRAPDDPETPLDQIRIALDADDPQAAQSLLSTLPARPPQDWPQRRHALHLRTQIALGDLHGVPDHWQAARDHAQRAHRLYPRHTVLKGLFLALRERLDDWDDLARDLVTAAPDPVAKATLARLGLPDPAGLPAQSSPEAAAALQRQFADLALQAGDINGALAATCGPALPSPAAAARAEWRVEALLWQRQPGAADALLDPLLAAHPARLGLILQRARAAFFRGDFVRSEGALAAFRAAKTAQTGLPPAEDLRDLITADALASGHALPEDEDPAASAARLGPALREHPGLAACWMARPGTVRAFVPDPGATIPRRLTLYWEGPMPAPVTRGIRTWKDRLPGWDVEVHCDTSARDWLARHDPGARAAFDRLNSPAARADLFRACVIAAQGGIYVDSDEYPRADITPWMEGARAVVVLESGYGTMANNFLAAIPRLPLFVDLRARVLERLAQVQDPYPWWDTGPAQATLALAGQLIREPAPRGLRVLSQAQYVARVTTNLPFPHKRGPGHWRQGLSRPPARGPITP